MKKNGISDILGQIFSVKKLSKASITNFSADIVLGILASLFDIGRFSIHIGQLSVSKNASTLEPWNYVFIFAIPCVIITCALEFVFDYFEEFIKIKRNYH